jgi:hypothetical protein
VTLLVYEGMTDPLVVLQSLDEHAQELDMLSKRLGHVETELEPITLEYEAFMGSYEEGLWEQHVAGAKLPSEAIRTRMAHRAMGADLLGAYMHLISERRRIEKRIQALKAIIDAKRSILSALKLELEAGGGGLRGGT